MSPTLPASPTAAPKPSRFLTQLGEAVRRHGHGDATADDVVRWSRGFILFHDMKHPQEMGRAEAAAYLEHVAQVDRDPLRAIEAAHFSLEFLFNTYLQRQFGELPRPRPPRLLDQVKQAMRLKHYAMRTEECYTQWIRRFILFHGKRHPRNMGSGEVELFLSDLAVKGRVSASTQNQALNALVFLYRDVLDLDLGRLEAVRARRPKRLPVVLAPEEVALVLARIEGADGVARAIAAGWITHAGRRRPNCCCKLLRFSSMPRFNM